MLRYFASILAVLSFFAFSHVAFGAKKGFYIGGSRVAYTVGGDINGKKTLVNDDGDMIGNVGEVAPGTGLAVDLGYNFGKNFGLEFSQFIGVTKASHKNESDDANTAVTGTLMGIRLSGPLGDSFDVFARLGVAAAGITYLDYGHKLNSGPPVTIASDEDFSLTGGGWGWSVGAEWMAGTHLGIGLGYTMLNVEFDSGKIGDQDLKLDKSLDAPITMTEITVLWHF